MGGVENSAITLARGGAGCGAISETRVRVGIPSSLGMTMPSYAPLPVLTAVSISNRCGLLGVTGAGVPELLEAAWRKLALARPPEEPPAEGTETAVTSTRHR